MQSNYEDKILHGSPEEVAVLLGELARLQALGWNRLMQPVGGARQGDETLLSIRQVAERLNIPESRAYELARCRDGFPIVKIGKYVRVEPKALEEWLGQQSRKKLAYR
jgi:excisionase family DNA binding protein